MKRASIRLAAFLLLLSLCMMPCASGAGENEKSQPPKKISSYIWEILLKFKPRSSESYYKVTAVIGVRGFSTAQPYEKSAFRFGALAAELRYAESVKDTGRAGKTSVLIATGLRQAGAVLPDGEEPLPADQLNPAIESFVKERKLEDFYQFGQWVGSLHLALLNARDGHMDAASQLLGKDSQVGYFLDVLRDRDVPPGVISNLRKLERMKSKTAYAERDVKEAIGYLENIILLLG